MGILHRRVNISYANSFERMYLVDYNDYARGDITFGFEVIRSRDDGCPGWFVLLPLRYTKSCIYELKRMIMNHYDYNTKPLIICGKPEQYQDYRYGVRITVIRTIDIDPILHVHAETKDFSKSTMKSLSEAYELEEKNAQYTKDGFFITSARATLNQMNCRFAEAFDQGTGMYHFIPAYTGINPLGLRLIRTDRSAYRIMMPNFITAFTFDYLQSFLTELLQDDNYLVFVKSKSTMLSATGLPEIEKSTAEFIYDPNMNQLIQKSMIENF